MALFRRAAHRDGSVEIEPLTPQRAAEMRPSLFNRLSPAGLARLAMAQPTLAWVVRGEEQIAIGGWWRRRRHEIGEVLEVTRGGHRGPLLRRLIQSFGDAGAALVVLDLEEQGVDSAFYRAEGFGAVERIVEYECRVGQGVVRPHPGYIRLWQPEDAEQVLEVEREAFPWIWWNSGEELRAYAETAGVQILVGLDGSTVLGYAGYTVRGTVGHLDRLAVRPSYQRKGHGGALLTSSLERMASQGVRRVSLSTQTDNYASQALYERYGFRRSHWSYEIWGRWLREPREATT